jgi:hypothetical protein
LKPSKFTFFFFLQIDIGEKSKGGDKNPVTEGDMRSHRVMYYGLKKTFPGNKLYTMTILVTAVTAVTTATKATQLDKQVLQELIQCILMS